MLLAMAHRTTIGEPEAQQRLKALAGWELDGTSIARKYTFDGFTGALAFVVRLGFDAEAADHHPDILINYKRVTLTYTTHSEGGLTEKDFAGAAKASELAATMGGE
jgi:4a-hydroxytetrahydrobiopterin dehydratase